MVLKNNTEHWPSLRFLAFPLTLTDLWRPFFYNQNESVNKK